VPDNRGTTADELAEELGLSRKQFIDGALTLLLKAVMDVRKGRRLVTPDPDSGSPAGELVMPTLAALEWATKPTKLKLGTEAAQRVRELVDAAPAPGQRLKAAAKRRRR
jgi:hypothetical protein